MNSVQKNSVSNEGGARAKTIECPVSCAQHTGKVLLQINGTSGKCTLRRCTFWRYQPTRCQEPQMGNPKQFWVPETHFIHPMSNVESFAEFIGKIIFQI